MLRHLIVWVIVALAVAFLPATAAHSHTEDSHPEDAQEEGQVEEEAPEEPLPAPEEPAETPAEHEEAPSAHMTPDLILNLPEQAEPGVPFRLEAVLRDGDGAPVGGALIEFATVAAWGDWLRGDVALATATTDASGRAVASVDLRALGDTPVTARFAGDESMEQATAAAVVSVVAQGQVYRPDVGIVVPHLTVWWLVALVALVWSLFLVVAIRAFAIARVGEEVNPERRQFLSRYLVPAGMAAVAGSVGTGLVALITRSPRTHTNLGEAAEHLDARHRLPPIARIDERAALRALPALLDREVSFASEVLPLLRAKGGPHAHAPTYSPPPHGVRFDSYARIMATSGLVVPGRPAESRIVTVMLDPAVRMPPSVPPLPEEELQIMASWIAQGARDN